MGEVNDWLLIPGASYRLPVATGGTNTNNNLYVLGDYFCGSGIGRDFDGTTNNNNNQPDGTDEGTGVILQTNGPFMMVFNTDNVAGAIQPVTNQQNQQQQAKNELGFSLDYDIKSNCNQFDFATPPQQTST